MAIQILHRGVDPKSEQVFTKICFNCQSQLRFKSGDARREFHPGGGQLEPSYYSYEITCPVCKETVKATGNR